MESTCKHVPSAYASNFCSIRWASKLVEVVNRVLTGASMQAYTRLQSKLHSPQRLNPTILCAREMTSCPTCRCASISRRSPTQRPNTLAFIEKKGTNSLACSWASTSCRTPSSSAAAPCGEINTNNNHDHTMQVSLETVLVAALQQRAQAKRAAATSACMQLPLYRIPLPTPRRFLHGTQPSCPPPTPQCQRPGRPFHPHPVQQPATYAPTSRYAFSSSGVRAGCCCRTPASRASKPSLQ